MPSVIQELPLHPLETYIRELRDIRASGAAVAETSYYGPLATLLNEVGKSLKPKVRCIINLRNSGAGIPDGGLFTRDQFQKASDAEPIAGTLPARGAIEVKGTADDTAVTADGEQVARYWDAYGQVLVTNYRDFLLVGRDAEGSRTILESYHLAESEADFWKAAANPHKMSQAHGERFEEYLKRVMLYAAPIVTPKDVAWFLASYARDAKVRVEEAGDLPALANVRTALEEALGLKFEGEKGEHFFRSTLVQTLFYGVFSAWVLWSRSHLPAGGTSFNWKLSADYLRVPILRKLFYTLAEPGQLDELNLPEVLDWAGAVLNRVDRNAFFGQFDEGHAVQYFYEPFLEAFDPELRKELGVWYTPPEIVQYMVARVDTVLKEELDIKDGLADPNVYVLDPCCGTGAYLREVLKHIASTMQERGGDALLGEDLKRAAMERVFGFEIMPAPFVVAHLQLGLLMQEYGAPFSEEKGERPGVFLTNALTGWEPPEGPKKQLPFPELEEERDAAEHVKRDVPILVILGNPPYNAFAGVSPTEEQDLVVPFKEGLISEWGIKKFNLDDLYLRFFRLAERRVAENTGKGIVCYISNFSYLSDPSFVVLRKRFLEEFDSLWFDCMNGDSRETGKTTPDGQPDPSVFSTEYNREGIRVGTAIGLLVRKDTRESNPSILFRHFWGSTKRADLLLSLSNQDFASQYEASNPEPSNRLSFRPTDVSSHFMEWPKLPEISDHAPINGLMEKRSGALISVDKDVLERRMQMYYNRDEEWQNLLAQNTGLTSDAARFNARKAREKVLASETYTPFHLQRYALRPFDIKWCYYSIVRPLWNEPRPSLWAQCWEGNHFLMSRPAGVASPEGMPFFFTSLLGDNDFLKGHAYYIPIRFKQPEKGQQDSLLGYENEPVANLSQASISYLATVGINNVDENVETAGQIWMHVLAIGCSPAYLAENADGLRQDWPRIPMPNSKELFEKSAILGRQISALLDTEKPVEGVTEGASRDAFRFIATVSRVGGGNLTPDAGNLKVTAGWGHTSKTGITMPAKGKVIIRPYSNEEFAAISESAKTGRLATEQALAHLGESTCDIHLNDIAYWKNIPSKVWNYRIGGYQVIKKWLSYRESKVLGRALTVDEVREVTNMARRIAAILLLEPALDENYEKVKNSTYDWNQAAK